MIKTGAQVEEVVKSAIAQIIQRTCDHHRVKGKPWGFDSGRHKCSYAAGCAIGISVSDALAETMDELQRNTGVAIDKLLEVPEVQLALLSTERAPLWAVRVLSTVQGLHDECAINIVGRPDDQLRA